jgi:hypothetical protein
MTFTSALEIYNILWHLSAASVVNTVFNELRGKLGDVRATSSSHRRMQILVKPTILIIVTTTWTVRV